MWQWEKIALYGSMCMFVAGVEENIGIIMSHR